MWNKSSRNVSLAVDNSGWWGQVGVATPATREHKKIYNVLSIKKKLHVDGGGVTKKSNPNLVKTFLFNGNAKKMKDMSSQPLLCLW